MEFPRRNRTADGDQRLDVCRLMLDQRSVDSDAGTGKRLVVVPKRHQQHVGVAERPRSYSDAVFPEVLVADWTQDTVDGDEEQEQLLALAYTVK